MKKRIYAVLAALFILAALSGCGSGGEVIDYDLVFVNDSDATIVEVVVDFVDQNSGMRNADSSPLKRGETFGFEAGEYPVTVLVYDTAVGRIAEGELARIVIQQAPPEGERWYVTAKDGTHGIVLTADTKWPEGA
ncbi:MAG: hypothetical protein HDT35_07520 [Clostridiales bacterium]|nr:hypothetical protein [Clostridiales bacterium]